MKGLLLILFIQLVFKSIGQKANYANKANSSQRSLEISDFGQWSFVDNPIISNDGNYAVYTIYNLPLGLNTLVIQDTRNNWRLDILNGKNVIISDDSRYIVFMNSNDSLGIISLTDHS